MRPEERDQAYLWDMREAAQDVLEFTRDIDFATSASQKRTRFAVERQLLVIGEAASHVSETFRRAHPEIPWAGIIGLRNVLAHDYDDILVERVWLVSQQNVPPLEKRLSDLLHDSGPGGGIRAAVEHRAEAVAGSGREPGLQWNGQEGHQVTRPRSFDLGSCIGAGWVFGGHSATLEALIRMVKPGGSVIVGEPYWLQEPPKDYLEASGVAREDFGSHFANAEAGERRGLGLIHTIVSSRDDWDRYEGLQWYATAEYARTHPDDPDVSEVVERVAKDRATYLRWGRDTLGWAIYMFRVPTPRYSDRASMD